MRLRATPGCGREAPTIWQLIIQWCATLTQRFQTHNIEWTPRTVTLRGIGNTVVSSITASVLHSTDSFKATYRVIHLHATCPRSGPPHRWAGRGARCFHILHGRGRAGRARVGFPPGESRLKPGGGGGGRRALVKGGRSVGRWWPARTSLIQQYVVRHW